MKGTRKKSASKIECLVWNRLHAAVPHPSDLSKSILYSMTKSILEEYSPVRRNSCILLPYMQDDDTNRGDNAVW